MSETGAWIERSILSAIRGFKASTCSNRLGGSMEAPKTEPADDGVALSTYLKGNIALGAETGMDGRQAELL